MTWIIIGTVIASALILRQPLCWLACLLAIFLFLNLDKRKASMPIIQNQAADPAVHALCIRLARRFTDIIKPLLRQEEVGECLREAYMAAREELEKPPAIPEV